MAVMIMIIQHNTDVDHDDGNVDHLKDKRQAEKLSLSGIQ